MNGLSAFFCKVRKKGCQEISVLYDYDIEAMELICAEVFPSNSIDAGSYVAFIRDNDIRREKQKDFRFDTYMRRSGASLG